MTAAPWPIGTTRVLECAGGPIDGEFRELPRDPTRFAFSPDRVQEVAIHVVREVPKKDAAGLTLCVRECLVFEGQA